MPLYEYECEPAGHRFERIQKFSDPPVETCPTCGGKVRKLLSSPAIQFKGSGWYVTDYARKGQNGEAKGDKGSKSTSESKTESKETKTESKKSESASSTSEKSSSASSSTSATS